MSDRFRTKALALALVLSLAATTVAGCARESQGGGEESSSPGPKPGGTISFYIGDPVFIDPIDGQESEGLQVINAVFDSLVDFDRLTAELVPAAAESWEPNEDGSVWTFKLRKGAKFHNGREVTAADFKYAWERICDPANKTYINYHLSAIKGYERMLAGKSKELSGVKAVDDYTLEVTLSYPFADFEYVVGHPTLAPVPKEEVEKDPKAFLDMPIGNGPFEMSEPWKHGEYVKVVRFDDYYGEKALLDGVDFMVFQDEATAFAEFEAGNLDFTTIPSGRIAEIRKTYGESPDGHTVSPGKQVLTGPEFATYYLWLNGDDEYLKDPDLRKAISLAINRDAIAQVVYEGTRVPATGPVPEGIIGHQEGAWEFNAYDVAKAKEFLKKAGYPDGEGLPELQVSFNTGVGHENVMELIRSDLATIGVEAKFDGREWGQFSEFMEAKPREYQIARWGWGADYPIMDSFLYALFESESAENRGGYASDEVDDMLVEARRTTDAAERIDLYRKIERKVGEDMPLIAVVNYRHLRVGSARLRDFVFGPMSLAALDKAWVAEE